MPSRDAKEVKDALRSHFLFIFAGQARAAIGGEEGSCTNAVMRTHMSVQAACPTEGVNNQVMNLMRGAGGLGDRTERPSRQPLAQPLQPGVGRQFVRRVDQDQRRRVQPPQVAAAKAGQRSVEGHIGGDWRAAVGAVGGRGQAGDDEAGPTRQQSRSRLCGRKARAGASRIRRSKRTSGSVRAVAAHQRFQRKACQQQRRAEPAAVRGDGIGCSRLIAPQGVAHAAKGLEAGGGISRSALPRGRRNVVAMPVQREEQALHPAAARQFASGCMAFGRTFSPWMTSATPRRCRLGGNPMQRGHRTVCSLQWPVYWASKRERGSWDCRMIERSV